MPYGMAVFLVNASVLKRCLSSPFSLLFLINSFLNFLSIGTFVVWCEWILLELQLLEFLEPKNSEAKGMQPVLPFFC
jgi:hypothetical protein